jgi:hypothetical protein
MSRSVGINHAQSQLERAAQQGISDSDGKTAANRTPCLISLGIILIQPVTPPDLATSLPGVTAIDL